MLQTGPTGPPVAIQSDWLTDGGRKFCEAVRPFLASRPDLQQDLEEKRLQLTNLPAAIRALHTNAPFTPPPYQGQ